MEKIHFRPWEKGLMGKDMKVPFPFSKKKSEKNVKFQRKVSSLNQRKRDQENERIRMENAKLFKKLVTTKGATNFNEGRTHRGVENCSKLRRTSRIYASNFVCASDESFEGTKPQLAQ